MAALNPLNPRDTLIDAQSRRLLFPTSERAWQCSTCHLAYANPALHATEYRACAVAAGVGTAVLATDEEMALYGQAEASRVPEPPTDDAPCAVCGWTGPRTQYIGIERLPVAHPDGDHPADWLRAIRRPEPPAVDEREALDSVIRDALAPLHIDYTPWHRIVTVLLDAILASAPWRNRGRGPITDAAVTAYQEALADRGIYLQEWEARAALDAARPAPTVTPIGTDPITEEQRDHVADYLWNQTVGVAKSSMRSVVADAFDAARIRVEKRMTDD